VIEGSRNLPRGGCRRQDARWLWGLDPGPAELQCGPAPPHSGTVHL